MSNQLKARIIDSDVVKPFLDGYDNGYGAGYVQEESSMIADDALEAAVNRGENIIIPKVGGSTSIIEMAQELKAAGYTVDLYFNDISKDTSIMRSASRFAETGRYIDLNYLESIGDKPLNIFLEYANSGLFDYAEWRNNDVKYGEEPKLIWKTGDGDPARAVDIDMGASGRRGNNIQREKSRAQGSGQTHSRKIDKGGKAQTVDGDLNPQTPVKSGITAYDEALTEYGAHPKGEIPTRDIDVPKQVNDSTRVSRFVRTIMESDVVTDDMIPEIKEKIVNGDFSYTPQSNKAALEKADGIINTSMRRAHSEWDAVVDGDKPATKEKVAIGERLLQLAATDTETERSFSMSKQMGSDVALSNKGSSQSGQ